MRCMVVVAPFLVGRAIDDALYLCPADGSGTHDAGLYGDVERTVGEVLAAKLVGGSCDSLHLGMCGDIVECLGEVMGTSDDLAVAYYDGTDGYLTLAVSLLCFL